jgi:RNA polymerase sigma factor (sigma-70 family)
VATDRACVIGRDIRHLFDGGVLGGLSDGQLLERFQTGRGRTSEEAFATLIVRHGPLVLRTCQRILRHEHDARDAFQATFLILITKAGSLWVRDSLGPWLHRVAARAALRARSVRERRIAVEREHARQTSSPTTDDGRGDLLASLHEEIDRLPEHYRAVIVLCDLEGCTCEEAARRLACPIGTVGSRLARGREKLRGRLARRGLLPAGSAIVAWLSLDTLGASVPDALATGTVKLALEIAANPLGHLPSTGVAEIVHQATRSVRMAFFKTLATTFAAAAALCLIPISTYRAPAALRDRDNPKRQSVPEPKFSRDVKQPGPPAIEKKREAVLEVLDFANDPIRHQDSLLAEIGNMKPLIQTKRGFSMTSREMVLYRDGSVKLWTFDRREPVCPPLRHADPIREASFFDSSGLLVTTSDTAVKVWNGATGELRREIPGQFSRPLFFLQDHAQAGRFVTVDLAGRALTIWDAKTLEKKDTWQVKKPERLIGAGLSPDGTILATIAQDHSVTLWQAESKQEFARLGASSRQLGSVFVDREVKSLKSPVLQLHPSFWNVVKDLAPAEKEARPKAEAEKRDSPRP